MTRVEGIEVSVVTQWLGGRLDIESPLDFEVIAGGRSNLTYLVTDARGRRLILRRPPLHGVLASAHDMGREHRIIRALERTAVPVPTCLGFEPDAAVTGAPFYVMTYVDGSVVRDAPAAERLTVAARRTAADSLVDVLVTIHAVDPDEIGLGDLARRDSYIVRQLRRWQAQLHHAATHDRRLLDEIHDRLAAAIPDQVGTTIVHGDYRLDNLVVDPDTGAVRAVLDWELTTLGDPLADVGLLAVYWAATDEPVELFGQATTLPGFPGSSELVARYARLSGRDVSDLGFYLAFGYWKLACILEGVYQRQRLGAYGKVHRDTDVLWTAVRQLAQRAADHAREAGR